MERDAFFFFFHFRLCRNLVGGESGTMLKGLDVVSSLFHWTVDLVVTYVNDFWWVVWTSVCVECVDAV